MEQHRPNSDGQYVWPTADESEAPFWVYSDEALYDLEQERIFRGPTWNFLCLETEIPEPGDYKTTFVGEAPIIVVRDDDGGINALVNRCAHKGALVCFAPRGNVKTLVCVYHNWSYDLQGNLMGVAFRRGVGGKGGMEDDFDQDAHGLERLRVDSYRGLVFGSFDQDLPAIGDYLGPKMCAAIDRVAIKPFKVLGYHSQILPNNWKLYMENTKDSYHATLLHVFHNTFGVVRATMDGGLRISDNGWHSLSYTRRKPIDDQVSGNEQVRSLKARFSLEDASLLEHKLELGDDVTNSIQNLFPGLVVQQILNTIAVRQMVPRGIDRCELMWTILGFEDDDDEMLELRRKVNNLVGPAGFISMEDGCIGGFVQRGAQADPNATTFMRMGGRAIESIEGSRVSEAAVRGFWRAWRDCMGV